MPTDLHAVLVDVDITAGWAVSRFAENNELLKKKDVSKALLSAMPDNELGLTQQHSLLL